MSFERLIHEHDEIAILCDRVEVLARVEAPQAEQASEALRELDGAMISHFINEDELIYTHLLSGKAILPPALHPAEITDNLTALRNDWRGYRSEWTADVVAADWSSFCEETALVMTRLRERFAAETRLLYPLALQSGMISLRDRRR